MIKFQKDEEIFYNFNVHLGINREHGIQTSKFLNEWSESILTHDPKAHIIIGGDFNAFPGDGGEEQVEIIKEGKVLEH